MDPRLQRGEWADRLLLSDVVAFVGWVGLHEKVVGLVGSGPLSDGRGESGWCSDVTSTHGAWEHAGVRFLLSGAFVKGVSCSVMAPSRHDFVPC